MFSLLLALTLSQAPAPGTIQALAGTGSKGFAGDGGPATAALLNGPFDVALDADENVYFSDTSNHRIRKIDRKTGIISTIAGNGQKGYSGDGGPALMAQLNEPYGVEVDKSGNVYFVDRLNYRVRVIEAKSGIIKTVAGNGEPKYSGDGGPATAAGLKEPNGIALDGKGMLVIADVAAQRVRAVDLASGTIRTLIGTGKKASLGDGGPLAEASLMGPRAVAFGPEGVLYVCEREGNRVRRVDLSKGTIHAFAGTGKKGYSGDNGPAAQATFSGPKELEVDKAGNVYVVDTENQAIRKIDIKTGVITTIAGNGKRGVSPDGVPATAATLGRPHGVVVTADGTVLIGDTENHRIRSVR